MISSQVYRDPISCYNHDNYLVINMLMALHKL